MKLYIISAALFFCSNLSAMKPENDKNSLDMGLICKASGYSARTCILKQQTLLAENILNAQIRTQTRNRPCTLKRLLSPCLYLKPNPFRAKL